MTRKSSAQSRAPSQRQLRVGELVRGALMEVLQRGYLRDPDLVDVIITVSEVRMTPDLRMATAYFVPLGGGDEDAIEAALNRASPAIRGELNKRVNLRFSPKLRFSIDRTFDEANRIGSLLQDTARDGEES